MKLKKQPCYYCGAPPPSIREHAPPKMMFAGFECDSITVPSCEKHNTSKSIGDRAIVTALILSASQMLQYRDRLSVHLTENVVNAVKLLEPDFGKAKNEVSLRHLLIDPPEGLNIPLPYIQTTVNIRDWIRQLTAALVWSVVGENDPTIRWDEAWAQSPGIIPTSEPITTKDAKALLLDNQNIERQLDELNWLPGWSASPRKYPTDIYSFEVCFLEHPEKWDGMEIVFRHRFYNSTSVWIVWFAASQGVKARLMNAITEI